MNFLEVLEEKRKELNSLKKDYEEERKALEEGITKLKKERQIIIDNKKDNCERKWQDINKYYQLIEKYASFNPSYILPIFTQIMSTFELKEYIYKIINYKEGKVRKEKKYIILDKSDNKEILDLGSNKLINFYSYNYMYGFQKNYNLEYFPYLEEYINMVINYKIENKIIDISYDTLEDLMVKFILDKEKRVKQLDYMVLKRNN